ncbi:MAG: hypothetical protein JNM66_11915 [Bryobacterales bacterium]|nr:hypothetical protein [Bryobacterales bacterium]
MWSYKLFRIGALVSALNGILHLFGHFAGKEAKPVNSVAFQLHELMYRYKENYMGTMRTQGDFFDGMSLSYSVFMLTLAALGFTLRVERKPAIIIAAALAALLAISLTYWFVMPTVFLAAGMLCYAGSAYLEKK